MIERVLHYVAPINGILYFTNLVSRSSIDAKVSSHYDLLADLNRHDKILTNLKPTKKVTRKLTAHLLRQLGYCLEGDCDPVPAIRLVGTGPHWSVNRPPTMGAIFPSQVIKSSGRKTSVTDNIEHRLADHQFISSHIENLYDNVMVGTPDDYGHWNGKKPGKIVTHAYLNHLLANWRMRVELP